MAGVEICDKGISGVWIACELVPVSSIGDSERQRARTHMISPFLCPKCLTHLSSLEFEWPIESTGCEDRVREKVQIRLGNVDVRSGRCVQAR